MLPSSLPHVLHRLARFYRLTALFLGLSITALTIATAHGPAQRSTSAAVPAREQVLPPYQLSIIPANGSRTGP